MREVALIVVLSLALSGCGDKKSPAAPTPPPVANVEGNWTGTFEYTQSSIARQSAAIVGFAQTATTVSGNFALTSINATGSINGTISATSFTGTVQITMPAQGGGLCNGSGALNGPASSGAQTIRWSGPGFLTADCSNMPLGVTFVLQRR